MIAVDISGLGDTRLGKQLAKLEARIQKKIVRKALRTAGKMVLADARARVPVDTGALKKGLKLRAVKSRGGFVGVHITTPRRDELGIPQSAKHYYPAVLEYGAENHPARPYLRPALDANRSKAIEIIRSEIRKAVSSA